MDKIKIKRVAIILTAVVTIVFAVRICIYRGHSRNTEPTTLTCINNTELTHFGDVIDVDATSDYIYLTEDEINTLATLVYLEARGESYECQKAVASVIINRMTTTGMSLNEVVYQPKQFEPAALIERNEPNDQTLEAVKYVVKHGPTVPEYVTFFRADRYHRFGDLVDYAVIDNTYFSYSESLKENG